MNGRQREAAVVLITFTVLACIAVVLGVLL